MKTFETIVNESRAGRASHVVESLGAYTKAMYGRPLLPPEALYSALMKAGVMKAFGDQQALRQFDLILKAHVTELQQEQRDLKVAQNTAMADIKDVRLLSKNERRIAVKCRQTMMKNKGRINAIVSVRGMLELILNSPRVQARGDKMTAKWLKETLKREPETARVPRVRKSTAQEAGAAAQ